MKYKYGAINLPYGEKGLVHYNREYKLGGDMNFRKMFTVWTSKIFCLKEAITKNPFMTNNFAWCDISASRFNRKPESLRHTFLYNDRKIHP